MLLMTSSLGSIAQPRLGILLQPIPKAIELFSGLRLNPSKFCRIEFSILRPALRKKVIFDLGFCSRRAHRDARPVFEFKNRHFLFANRIALYVTDHLSFEISNVDHLRSEHF